MTRSSGNWTAQPGGYDALHCERHIWPSEEGTYGIPSLQPQTFDLPPNLRLLPYRSRLDRLDPNRDVCHFYLDDYRFESTWTRLDIGACHVSGYFATLTPRLQPLSRLAHRRSALEHLPKPLARSLLAGGGLRVIPTVNWSDQHSFTFCFDGTPPGQLLSIGTADCRRTHVQRRFDAGLAAMLERLQPRALIVYCRLQPQQRHLIEHSGCQLYPIAPA
ncbi:MAG: DUF4417 domain-containing protein [Chromatiaceae bacterium]|nr:DUF4417 domain-containing protein [Chromatiaceae bacterium]